MRSGFHIFMAWLFCTTAADAGAWLREKGSSFTSSTLSATWLGDTASTSYLEYGLRDDLTIGTDIATANSHLGVQTGYGMFFIRRPLGRNDAVHKWAYELGIGAAWIDQLVLPYVKTGLSWGRSIKLHETNGWIAVDASMNWEVSTGHHLAKLDATVGLNLTEATTGMLQLYIGNLDDNTYASIAPSLVFHPRKTKFRIQIGAESQLGDLDNSALKIGIWRAF